MENILIKISNFRSYLLKDKNIDTVSINSLKFVVIVILTPLFMIYQGWMAATLQRKVYI